MQQQDADIGAEEDQDNLFTKFACQHCEDGQTPASVKAWAMGDRSFAGPCNPSMQNNGRSFLLLCCRFANCSEPNATPHCGTRLNHPVEDHITQGILFARLCRVAAHYAMYRPAGRRRHYHSIVHRLLRRTSLHMMPHELAEEFHCACPLAYAEGNDPDDLAARLHVQQRHLG